MLRILKPSSVSRIRFSRRFCTPFPLPHNHATALSEIDAALKTGPPAIEYIWTAPPWWRWSWWNSESTGNPYGHSCVRYTLPNGEQHLVNIWGNRKTCPDMIHFMDPTTYFFEDPVVSARKGSEQGGIFKRSFLSIRVEKVPGERIEAMHNFYLSLKKESDGNTSSRKAKFVLVLPHIFNFLQWLFPTFFARSGNCAVWSTSGIKEAGVIDWVSMFPKVVLLRMFWHCVPRYKVPSLPSS